MSWSINAQDERYLRQIFSGELNKEKEIAARKYSYVIHTPYYALDLNGNNLFEYIVFVKKDSEDWIEILDENKLKIFSYQFEAKGFDSELYRVELKRLGPQVSILLLYYYEGISRYLNFQGTSRVYAITIDNQDLKTLKAFKGTVYFDETKNMKGHYHKRNYQVFLEDLNNDSVKELIIKYRRMTDVFLYKGEGKWQTFNQNQ
ncbi:MAG: hypothetical protein HOP07_12275 [Bacteriovoracaceae bacterium]|nr:hypothetical protein [Bacteriovoracaceae bacterium]